MERRKCRRKNIRIEAEMVSGDTTCKGMIENISEQGIYLETESTGPLSTSTRFSPGSQFQVKFQTPEGETLKLDCRVMWSFKTGPYGLRKKIGMEVIFPPPAYIDFCNTPDD